MPPDKNKESQAKHIYLQSCVSKPAYTLLDQSRETTCLSLQHMDVKKTSRY